MPDPTDSRAHDLAGCLMRHTPCGPNCACCCHTAQEGPYRVGWSLGRTMGAMVVETLNRHADPVGPGLQPPDIPEPYRQLVAACRSLRDDLRDGGDTSETDLRIHAALDAIDAAKTTEEKP